MCVLHILYRRAYIAKFAPGTRLVGLKALFRSLTLTTLVRKFLNQGENARRGSEHS